jgi:hypothetical protein
MSGRDLQRTRRLQWLLIVRYLGTRSPGPEGSGLAGRGGPGARPRMGGPAMTTQIWLTTREVGEIFENEIGAAGGKVRDRFDDGTRLYLRAILPGEREVRPGDRVQGGVALRGTQEEISVHPYLFRQVCSNGAIRAHALESRHILRPEFSSGDESQRTYELVEAIRQCCTEAAFAESAREMRSAQTTDMDRALEMLPVLAGLAHDPRMRSIVTSLIHQYLKRLRDGDHSRFSFMNLVTATARDQRDPEIRWRLEVLGGKIPVAAAPGSSEPQGVRQQAENMLLHA